ncbi:hypothetical protein EES45_08480 [Streptomyces sp. ADI97-07]|nr:hypothetical protein EES45_08480 [Streptomyces sp. ADI97-07]
MDPGPARPGTRRGGRRPGLAPRRADPAHRERADRAADRPQSARARRAHRVVARGQLRPSRPDEGVRPLQPRHRCVFRQASAGGPRPEGEGVPPGRPRSAGPADAAPGRRRVEVGRPARGRPVAAAAQEPLEPARGPLDRHGGLLLLDPAGRRHAGPLPGQHRRPRPVRSRSAVGRRPLHGAAPGERDAAHRAHVVRRAGHVHVPGRPRAGAVHRRERTPVVVGDQPPGARRGRAGPAGGACRSPGRAVAAEPHRTAARGAGPAAGPRPRRGGRRRLRDPRPRGRRGRRHVVRRPGPRPDRTVLRGPAAPGDRRPPGGRGRGGPAVHPPCAGRGGTGAAARIRPARDRLRGPSGAGLGRQVAHGHDGGGRDGRRRAEARRHRSGGCGRAGADVLGAGQGRGDAARRRPGRGRAHHEGAALRPRRRRGRRDARRGPDPPHPRVRGRPEHVRPGRGGRVRPGGARRLRRALDVHDDGFPHGRGPRLEGRLGGVPRAGPVPGAERSRRRTVGRAGRVREGQARPLPGAGVRGPAGQRPPRGGLRRRVVPGAGRRVRRTARRGPRSATQGPEHPRPPGARRARRARVRPRGPDRPTAGPERVVESVPGGPVRDGRRRHPGAHPRRLPDHPDQPDGRRLAGSTARRPGRYPGGPAPRRTAAARRAAARHGGPGRGRRGGRRTHGRARPADRSRCDGGPAREGPLLGRRPHAGRGDDLGADAHPAGAHGPGRSAVARPADAQPGGVRARGDDPVDERCGRAAQAGGPGGRHRAAQPEGGCVAAARGRHRLRRRRAPGRAHRAGRDGDAARAGRAQPVPASAGPRAGRPPAGPPRRRTQAGCRGLHGRRTGRGTRPRRLGGHGRARRRDPGRAGAAGHDRHLPAAGRFSGADAGLPAPTRPVTA